MANTELLEHSPASPPASSRGSARRADIQGMRAVAVLLVVAFHAGVPLSGGFVGVDVFFVISGFVITAMLLRQRATSGRISLPHFYFRRFLRLTPALALLVTVVAATSVLLQNPYGAQQTTARTGLGAMLLSANGVLAHASGDYFATNATTNPLLHTWSLSVEEQFYLVFPSLMIAAWALARRRRGRSAVFLVVAVVAVLSFAASVAFTFGSTSFESFVEFFGGPQTFAFYSPFTRAWEFAVGALLALAVARAGASSVVLASSRIAALVAGILGAGLIAVSAVVLDESMPFPGLVVLLPVTGTLLLLLAGTSHNLGVNALLATRGFVGIGDLSYSWYLWHWPPIVFAALLFPGNAALLIVVAVASILPAVISYRYLEQPLRRLRPKSRPRAAAVIATTVAIPLVACGVLLAGANSGWGLTPPGGGVSAAADLAVADGEVAGGEGGTLRAQHIAVRSGCVNTDLRPRTCTFGPGDAKGTVILAGDSQAYALADGVVAAATSLGYRTLVTSHTGCPFLARESSGVHNYPCRDWQKSIVAYALRTRPAAVLIANLSEGYVHPEAGWRTAATPDGGRAGSVDEAVRLWRAGLDPIVKTLRDAGIGVMIISSVPQMPGYTDGTSLLSSAIGTRDFSVSRQESEASRKPAIDAERDIAREHPGTVVLDPNPGLCDAHDCWAAHDGAVLYQDETHVSVAGSMRLVPGVRDALSRTLTSAAVQS